MRTRETVLIEIASSKLKKNETTDKIFSAYDKEAFPGQCKSESLQTVILYKVHPLTKIVGAYKQNETDLN